MYKAAQIVFGWVLIRALSPVNQTSADANAKLELTSCREPHEHENCSENQSQ